MRERPILFSGAMVNAILAGRKTQTRRIVQSPARNMQRAGDQVIAYRPPGDRWYGDHVWSMRDRGGVWNDYTDEKFRALCPYGQPGDRLVVKEAAWMWCERRPNGTTKTGRQKWHYVAMREAPVLFCADHPEKPSTSVVHPETENQWGWHKKIGRFLPKWASRLTLEVTEVRVERLQDISEADARAEGVTSSEWANHRERFQALWDSINADRADWASNPWVWVVGFKVAEVRR